ncbi:quinone oxidoreductase [Nevskia sp.]|uniref:quinone oxidoreductase family protein n=1 Tax=Nevskia sp. TaxID=1929292 RepID=UPI0025CC8B9E|nr:quinone oxidoreductase [Nevskia sp.]
MSLSIRVTRHGGPEVLELADETLAPPAAGEVRLRQTAIGLNFIDTYFRAGVYKSPFPHGLGQEAAGVVEALGEGVTDFVIGDRVAYGTGPLGAYAESRNFAASRLVKLPDSVSDEAAAALMLKGMTAYYLLHQTHAVQSGETLLVHAAAGGVGSALVPWAKRLGARVIGTVGSTEKAALATAAGCDDVILYREQDVATEVRRLTAGRGVDVVYDSVGRDTFAGSLDCLRPRGLFVSYGNASGKAAPFEPVLLAEKGSLFFTRPTLAHYTATRAELNAAAKAVFDAIASGIIEPQVLQRWPLRDAAAAHIALESRQTRGASVLLP